MADPSLTSVSVKPDGVDLEWSEGLHVLLPLIWLRDNCRCSLCGDTTTGHRFVTLADLDPPRALGAALESDGTLRVTWDKGHESRYGPVWLGRHARPAEPWSPVLWDSTRPPDLAALPLEKARDGDGGTLELLRRIRDQGVVLVSGLGPDPEDTEAMLGILGSIQVTSYGHLFHNRNDGDGSRLSNTDHALPPHTDEPFRYTPPGIIAFHCVNPAPEGGDSILIDGFRLAAEIRSRDAAAFELLTTLPQSHERRIEDTFDLVCHARVIALDGFGRVCGFRFAERSASPPPIDLADAEELYVARRLLAELVADPAFRVTVRLKAGDMLLFDNHRLMHGRTAIRGSRYLRQASVAREDAHSTLRRIARRLGAPDADLDMPMGALA